MWAEAGVAWATILAAVLALGGVVVRRRVGVCWMFVPYLGVTVASDLLMLAWPERFYHLWFYVSKELLIDVLRFALALELTYRTFRAFPSARATVRAVLLLILLVTFSVVFASVGNLTPAGGVPILGPVLSRVQPLVLSGTIWLLTGVAGLILWYRLPVHPLHKAILLGLVSYLLVFTVSLNLLESWGWEVRGRVNAVHTLAFLLLTGYWAIVAWRPDEAAARPPAAAADPTFGPATG